MRQKALSVERSLLIGIALIGTAVWGFIGLADQVLEDETHAFDRALLLAMRTPGDLNNPIGPSWLEEMMRDFTAFGGVGMLLLLSVGVAAYLLLRGERFLALYLFFTIWGGNMLGVLLKEIFERPRPDLVSQGSIVSLSSFPSGHSMISAVTYLTLGAVLAHMQPNRRLRHYILSVAILITALVGISRVYLGVHWPTDVLAGWAAGAAWALLSLLLLDWLYDQHVVAHRRRARSGERG